MVGIAQDTFFVQVAYRCAIGSGFRTAADGCVGLVGHGCIQHDILPVCSFSDERNCTRFSSEAVTSQFIVTGKAAIFFSIENIQLFRIMADTCKEVDVQFGRSVFATAFSRDKDDATCRA